MSMEVSGVARTMANDTFGPDVLFESSMIANERYRDAIYDETGLLYTKLALSSFQRDPEKAKNMQMHR